MIGLSVTLITNPEALVFDGRLLLPNAPIENPLHLEGAEKVCLDLLEDPLVHELRHARAILHHDRDAERRVEHARLAQLPTCSGTRDAWQ